MSCNKHPENKVIATRRQFLSTMGTGFGMLALGSLNAQDTASLQPRSSHFPGTAKRVIHLYQSGAQSHIDTWDHKPELTKAAEGSKGMRKLLPSPFSFSKQGQSGLMMSEVWPQLSTVADDLCVINSCFTDVPDHENATLTMTTGDARLPKPSIGSWAVYGLGSMNQNLPSFVSLNAGGFPTGGNRNWSSAFMPGIYQGTYVDTNNTKIEKIIENIRSDFANSSDQRKQLDMLSKLNEIHKQKRQADPALEARIQSFELAFKMQTDAVEAFDVERESEAVKTLYGYYSTNRQEAAQARQMLVARRLLERGVRFVQCWNGGWDHHNNVNGAVRQRTAAIDRPIAAFLKDLKSLGMLKDTLVVSSTEFGRSSTEDGPGGRSHNAKAFSSWLAGGGIKGGVSYGATDELGSAAVDNKVHVHELHATILHALGFDAQQLTYRSGGRDFRLTDVSNAMPVKALFA
jgi:hypothetical protein